MEIDQRRGRGGVVINAIQIHRPVTNSPFGRLNPSFFGQLSQVFRPSSHYSPFRRFQCRLTAGDKSRSDTCNGQSDGGQVENAFNQSCMHIPLPSNSCGSARLLAVDQ